MIAHETCVDPRAPGCWRPAGECGPCPGGQFKEASSAATQCTAKADCTGLIDEQAYAAASSDDAVKTYDDTVCRPSCAAGQGYQTNDGVNPDLDDQCVACPLNEYQNASYPHHDACTPCTGGTVTESTGSTSPSSCVLPQVRAYRSTHRIWYHFGEAVKANTDCTCPLEHPRPCSVHTRTRAHTNRHLCDRGLPRPRPAAGAP